MICDIAKTENTVIDTQEDVEILLSDGIFRSVRFAPTVKRVTVMGGKAVCGFVFEGDTPVTLVLIDCAMVGFMGAPPVAKDEGTLEISVEGKCELQGCNASFGPSSFGESPAISACRVTLNIKSGASLSLGGGRTFQSLFEDEANYCAAVQCKKLLFKE